MHRILSIRSINRIFRNALVAVLLMLGPIAAVSQPLEPSHWSFAVEEATAESAELVFTVRLDEGWHIYSTRTDDGGPLPTEFHFDKSPSYSLSGGIKEPKPHEEYDELFKVTVRDFSGVVTFRQRVKRSTNEAFKVQGTYSFQLCNNGSCIAPEEHSFVFDVPAVAVEAVVEPLPVADSSVVLPQDSGVSIGDGVDATVPAEGVEATNGDERGEQSLWMAFLIALLGGLLTMITPCVFPMVPMTVNYFIHDGKRRQAWIFGISIVLIFAVMGAILTLLFGPEALYFLGTHWIPNLLFFIIFLLFSLSFFGLFELQLPSRWVNRSDAEAGKGGWLAPFFMALTTVLVSFSCTGPILGAALVGLATSTTNAWVSLVTMLGFGIGFALPFTLLALFPQWLKGLKSGSWLATVKVVFAFLELAFGLKFLSMADLYCGWHLLDREVYLALWIVIFALLGFYLLGKLRFKDEAPVEHLGVVRLFLAIAVFAFVVYMVPGMFGAPLKAISGFLPPMETQDFNIEKIVGQQRSDEVAVAWDGQRKYADKLQLPVGYEGYFDLDEAKEAARKESKPIFIDFTGKTCANCREMEHYVWADPSVRQMMNDDFVICALYVDENTIERPEEEWLTTEDGKVLKTLGRRNLHIEKTLYNMNAQPYYVIIDADGNRLTRENYQYNRNPRKFEQWLSEGLANYGQQR